MKRDIKKLAIKLQKELNEDILFRYGNSEYYEPDIADRFYQDNQLTETEIQKLIEILGL